MRRPIVAGTMLGELLRDEPVRPESMRPGDIVVLTRGIAIEGTAILAVERADVHALHDPTEGGLAAGLRELAHAGDVGVDVDYDAITVRPETRAICDALDLDPLGLLASGALLVVVPPGEREALLTALEGARIEASVIGTVTEAGEALRLIREDRAEPFPEFEQDELARLLEAGG